MLPSRVSRCAGTLPATLILLAAGLSGAPAHAADSVPVARGERTAAAILVNFADNANEPVTPSQAYELVFGEVSDFYWEASYQTTFLSGDVYGWLTLPLSAASCDTAKIAQEAGRAATAAGADLDGYDNLIYLFPYNTGCGWSGRAELGSNGQGRVFINAAFDGKTVAHELGHVYGLDHADALDCGTRSVGGECVRRGYADQADAMGNRGAHFNAFNKERLGWLGREGMPAITTVERSGRYEMETYEVPGQGAKALKILKGVDPVTGAKTWYYVEYRQPIGVDAVLAGVGNLVDGVLVRTGSEHDGIGTSLLLDMTPDSDQSTASSDVKDGALEPGRSFVDADAGVTITLASADDHGAVVDVSLEQGQVATCVRAAPALDVVTSSPAVAAGVEVDYVLSLVNRDSDTCGATTFDLAAIGPPDFSAVLETGSLTLSPGASAGTALRVTSPDSAVPGDYPIRVDAVGAASALHAVSASAGYSIASVVPLTNAVATDRSSYGRGDTVHMSALVRRDGSPIAGIVVRFEVTLPNGRTTVLDAVTASDGHARARYGVGKGKSAIGDYRLRAEASGDAGVASANAKFSVH